LAVVPGGGGGQRSARKANLRPFRSISRRGVAEAIRLSGRPAVERPVMVVDFAGWNDAADVAEEARDHRRRMDELGREDETVAAYVARISRAGEVLGPDRSVEVLTGAIERYLRDDPPHRDLRPTREARV
jgi:hypothetical protein